jgi:hypothetical protein
LAEVKTFPSDPPFKVAGKCEAVAIIIIQSPHLAQGGEDILALFKDNS